MTRPQQDATRALLHAEKAWLQAYGWSEVMPGRWAHKSVPIATVPARASGTQVTLRDAIAFTRADPLKYGEV